MPNNLDELIKRLELLAERAAGTGALYAADGMAQLATDSIKSKLGGASPSEPGTPPGRRSGDLQDSIKASPPVAVGGEAVVEVGPDIIYGRIQELGGDTGRNHATHLEPRPYLEPSLTEGIASGGFTAAAILGFLDGVGW